jgi:hypothetical protein
MARRADILLDRGNIGMWNGGGTYNIIVDTNGYMWHPYVQSGSQVMLRKSVNGGLSWQEAIAISTPTTITNWACWFDRWSGISGDKIHFAYANSADDDINYRNNDVGTATLGTQTVVFAGASTAAGGALSITRARGGNLVVAGSIDAGAEDGCWKSTDVGATWAAAIADASEAATQDQYMLAPGWNADTQDVMLFFWDASANEISVKRYDDSANTWGETSVAASMTDITAATSFPHYNVCVDLTNSQNLLVAWSNVDTLNSDLRCWKVTDTTITETTTNVVLNSTDDQAFCAIGIDTVTEYWYVWYCGTSGGTETVYTDLNVYYKVSTDGGATWGAENKVSDPDNNRTYIIKSIACTPRFTRKWICSWFNDSTVDDVYVSAEIQQPRASYALGI